MKFHCGLPLTLQSLTEEADPDAIKRKYKRLGLEVVVIVFLGRFTTTSELEIPEELPSVEEV